MKHFITILMILLFANVSNPQSNDYNLLWKKVEKLEADGLPKSALEIVEQIATLAKKDKNAPQHIKTLLYKGKYAMTLEEEAQIKIINDFKAEIETTETPTKNVLQNILATMYWQYFQQNRYKFYDRTNTASKVDATDFRTWDLQTLFDEIHHYYKKSLENGLILQQTNLEAYEPILMTQKDSKIFRPTLYDLLAHNALAFYTTDENSITQPAYKFQIDDKNYLNEAKSFAILDLSSKDSTSLQLNALKLYQKLIAFHQRDEEPYALADVDIERLKFVNEHATFPNKETELLSILKASSKTWKSHEVSALYDFEIASLYNNQGQSYQAKENEEHRWKIKEALELCNATIAKYPKSKGAKKCEVLKQQILQPSLQIVSEELLPTQKNALMLIRFKNLEQLQFKIYNLSRNQLDAFNKIYRQKEQLAFIKKLEVSTQFQSSLKNESDYQNHATEILIPKLDNGNHLIFAAKAADSDQLFAFKTIQVTDIALVNKSESNKELFQVINRNTGEPIVGANIKLSYKRNWNGSTLTDSKTTDKQGEFSIIKNNNRLIDLNIEVSTNGENAYFKDYYVNQNYDGEQKDKVEHRAFLFTDRSIYRPGQTLYFKGIVMKAEDGKTSVIADKIVIVTLNNVNGEKVKDLTLKTNEFGSVASEFIIPSSGLTGNYTIQLAADSNHIYANTSVSVEEYKRPKFQTTFDPVTETYKVNDSITINGNALAYAGSNITDAKVVYRVVRKVRYPSWYYWYRPWFVSTPQEITHGESITNDKGEFEITFKAIPDESVDKKTLPIFQYEVTADITDLNGETRSATTIVNVGYHALLATVTINEQLDKTKKDYKLAIDTKNLNGEFAPATGTLKIYKLKAPQNVLRPRPWSAPDYQEFSNEEFKRMFPHEAYFEEHNPDTWEKGEIVFDTTFDTSKSKEIELGNIKKWQSGKYVVVLESKDKFGQLVKAEAKTTLYDEDDKTLADYQLFSVTTNQSTFKANETVVMTFGSSAENVTVTVDVEKNQKVINTYIIPLSNNKKNIAIPVTKDDIGGFVVHYSFAAFNYFESGTEQIAVPYPKTDLDIETVTFRDKLQPGTDETWSFKIKGPQGDKVSAELLASMYDMSLDQFKPHQWDFSPIPQPIYNSGNRRSAGRSFGIESFRVYNDLDERVSYPYQAYDQLNWFGFYFGNSNSIIIRGRSTLSSKVLNQEMVEMEVSTVSVDQLLSGQAAGVNVSSGSGAVGDSATVIIKGRNSFANDVETIFVIDGITVDEIRFKSLNPNDVHEIKVIKAQDSTGKHKGKNVIIVTTKNGLKQLSEIKIRKNLQETAFFFPQLQTDAEGNVSFSFTTPEALTKWKLQLLAHTKTLESTTTSLETVTQKELMVIPNAPRFLRQGDQITISTKIANLTEKALSGQAKLELTDGLTGNSIDVKLNNSNNTQSFSVDAKGNTQVSWSLTIPDDVQAVQYKVLAKSGDFSDGEQNALPVLTNRMLVTETLPMWIRSNETRTFTLDKLQTNTSTTLKNHKLTLEMTSNPAWYAVQALPYLMEFPYECNEQTFSRYYANSLASHIANSNPRIQEVFNQWRSQDALISNLEKNEELKNILIQETPWLRDAQSETEQKKRIALLFDINKMNNELQLARRKLANNQMSNGAWPWFDGGRPNRYITQHIITGFGHLKQLNVSDVLSVRAESRTDEMINKAMNYLDAEFVQEYKDIRKYNKEVDLSKDHLSYTQLHYLYMRSFFPEIEKSKEVRNITEYYQTQIQKYWLSRPLYAKGLMALVSHRSKDLKTANNILKSLKETSISNDELGMYWKENVASWYWYQAPVETQALMIETFAEIENDTTTIDNLKIWLLKNKQTNSWSTTKATTEAVYALLLQGSDWLSVTEMVEVVLGGQTISPSKLENVKVEAGTGYYKTSWNDTEIKPEMATVKLTKKGNGIAWGALYWQYFEDLDKITSAETPLKLKKQLFLKTNTDKGEQISAITDKTDLKVGDLVRVRIELRSDRDMEFIHMKDMRAAGLEPINVLSQYKYKDDLGYYESTKDAATNFFFDFLPKGVYVFEYDLRVNNAGNMSNGITTIQSMYAPEFTSHSEGVRITVN